MRYLSGSLLPRVELVAARRREATEFPENYSQEWEDPVEIGEGISSVAKASVEFTGVDTGAKQVAKKLNPEGGGDCNPRMKPTESTRALAKGGCFPPISPEIPISSAARKAQACRSLALRVTKLSWAGSPGYSGYQLIRNVLAAYAQGSSFCVVHDERRPDLREAWFRVLAAVKSAEMRVRLKVLTWQELAVVLPRGLQEFLDLKYGIVGPGKLASPIDGISEFD